MPLRLPKLIKETLFDERARIQKCIRQHKAAIRRTQSCIHCDNASCGPCLQMIEDNSQMVQFYEDELKVFDGFLYGGKVYY